jgi:hypothetical protein
MLFRNRLQLDGRTKFLWTSDKHRVVLGEIGGCGHQLIDASRRAGVDATV